MGSLSQGCGQVQEGNQIMAVYQLDIENRQWTVLKPTGVPPPARGSHSVGLVGYLMDSPPPPPPSSRPYIVSLSIQV